MAAEVQLTRLGDVGPGKMSTTLWRHRGATASKFLSAEQLAVLGARAAGPAAGCPLPSLPAVNVGGAERKTGGDVWGCQAGTLRGEEHILHSESAFLAGKEAARVSSQSKGRQPF